MFLKRKIHNFVHPIQGEIWCLHRVVHQRSIFPSNRELEITPQYLEKLITERIQQGFKFITIDNLISNLGNNRWDLRRKKCINISFDDGFRDVYDNAFPIFKKYNIPFTIYLVSDFPKGKSDLWWIQLEKLVNNDVPSFERLIKSFYKSERNMRDLMHEQTNSTPDFGLCEQLSLTWDQVNEMIESGLCTIGCHSMSHPALTRITNEELMAELTESKHIIENHIHTTVKHFSYPHSMENLMIQSLLQELGYISATIGYGGNIRKGHYPFKLNRKYIVQE